MRRALILCLLLAAPLAGCIGPTDAPSDPPITSTGTGSPGAVGLDLRVAATQHLTGDGYGFEPSLAVADDGTIYVTAARGAVLPVPTSSRLWVSNDGGGSFQEIAWADPETGISNLPAGAEGDLAIDAAGNAYFVDLTYLAGTSVSRSTDGGRTWELRSANAFAVPVGDREWVAAGAEDTVAVVWNQLATGLWVAVSTDGGQTFPTQTLVPGYSGTFVGGLDIGPNGTIYTARTTSDGTYLLRSTDRGSTFTAHLVRAMDDGHAYIFPIPTTDEAGNLYLAWAEEADGNVDVFYAHSQDKGDTWSEPVQVSHHRGASVLPWIDARAPGHVAVAYYGAPGHVGDPNEVEADWYPYLTEVHDATSAAPRQQVVRLSEDPVKRDSVVCTGGLSCSGGRELADYLQVEIGPDEHPQVVWGDEASHVYWGKVAPSEAPTTLTLQEALAIPDEVPDRVVLHEETVALAGANPAAPGGDGALTEATGPARVDRVEVPAGLLAWKVGWDLAGVGAVRAELVDPDGTVVFATPDALWAGAGGTYVGYTGIGGKELEAAPTPGTYELRYYVVGSFDLTIELVGRSEA